MIKYVLIISFFLPVTVCCQAAETQFLIYHTSKPVQWLHDGKSENAGRGVFIKNRQSIIVPGQSDIMLIKSDGRSLLIDQPGTYSFQQIRSLFQKSKNTGVVSGFFAYVFEKFLNSSNGDDKQKVSAAVYRARIPMKKPADSSFVFNIPFTLEWVPDQRNLPYRVFLKVNDNLTDTVVRGEPVLALTQSFLNSENGAIVSWNCIPYDSKQPSPPDYIYIIPTKKDARLIEQQINELKRKCAGNEDLFQTFEKDLFERWLELYQLQ